MYMLVMSISNLAYVSVSIVAFVLSLSFEVFEQVVSRERKLAFLGWKHVCFFFFPSG